MTLAELDARYAEAIKGKPSVSIEDFRCKRCGACCGGYFKKLSLSLEDLFNASAAVKMGPIAFFDKYCQRELIDGKWSITMDISRGCPFHEEGMGCSIHEHKPIACRSYPFLKTEIMYVGDQPFYGKIPGCAYAAMNPEAIIRHDVEVAVTSAMWDRVTDYYLSRFDIGEKGLMQFYFCAKGYIRDPAARAMIRDESIVTTMKLNTVYREKRRSLPAGDVRAQRDQILFASFMEDCSDEIPEREDGDGRS